MDLFKDLIPSILQNKEHIINSEFEEREYVPYTVNKALSQHIDCIFHVNEMNNNPHLDKKLQYDYYFYAVRKYKRQYQKWHKNTDPGDLLIIKEYYQCNTSVAKEYYKILTEDQIKSIKSFVDKGGKSK